MEEVITRNRTRRDFILVSTAGVGLLLTRPERLALAAGKQESKEEEVGPITGVVISGAVLLMGFVARLALGAHWPSDLLLSSLIGFLWVALLIRFV